MLISIMAKMNVKSKCHTSVNDSPLTCTLQLRSLSGMWLMSDENDILSCYRYMDTYFHFW